MVTTVIDSLGRIRPTHPVNRQHEWQMVHGLPVFGIAVFPHGCTRDPGRKCALHQTLVGQQKSHGLRIHAFHENGALWVVRLPDKEATPSH